MAEWLYEPGIGEARAALIEGGRIVEMLIEPDGERLRAGAVVDARVMRKADASGRARVDLGEAGEAWLVSGAGAIAEGTRLRVEIVREALPEAGAFKPPHVRPVETTAPLRAAPDLAVRIAATGHALRRAPAGEDLFEAHGWSESLEEASRGIVARADAMLRISLTPAMTLIDVDGPRDAATLACAGARLAGEAIRRFDIAGSIGIDLPTLANKADRLAAALALDGALPQPFERTAVNGFGFLQVVRRRVRASLPELLAADPIGAAARALLRRAERARGHGPLMLAAAPVVIERLAAKPDWLDELTRRTGVAIALSPAAGLAISAGHAQHEHA